RREAAADAGASRSAPALSAALRLLPHSSTSLARRRFRHVFHGAFFDRDLDLRRNERLEDPEVVLFAEPFDHRVDLAVVGLRLLDRRKLDRGMLDRRSFGLLLHGLFALDERLDVAVAFDLRASLDPRARRRL